MIEVDVSSPPVPSEVEGGEPSGFSFTARKVTSHPTGPEAIGALELASRPALLATIPSPPSGLSPPAKATFKLRATAAAWFPRRKRTRRPCHARPTPDRKGGRRPPAANALYALAQIAHAYRHPPSPKLAPIQAPKDTAPLRPPAQHSPKIITRRPSAPTRRSNKGPSRGPTDCARSVPISRCVAFIYLLVTYCVAMYITVFHDVAKSTIQCVDYPQPYIPILASSLPLSPPISTWQQPSHWPPFNFTHLLMAPDLPYGSACRPHKLFPVSPRSHPLSLCFGTASRILPCAFPTAHRVGIG